MANKKNNKQTKDIISPNDIPSDKPNQEFIIKVVDEFISVRLDILAKIAVGLVSGNVTHISRQAGINILGDLVGKKTQQEKQEFWIMLRDLHLEKNIKGNTENGE